MQPSPFYKIADSLIEKKNSHLKKHNTSNLDYLKCARSIKGIETI